MSVPAGSVLVRFVGNTRSFDKATKQFSQSLGRIGKRAAIAMTAIGVASAKMASDFDKGLREISTLLNDVTDKDLKKFGDEIIALGQKTGQSFKSLTKARYDIISAGFTGASESALMLEASTKLAVGGVSEVAKTADVLTSALNAYGMEASEVMRVSDALFTTVRLGKTTVDELSAGLGMILPFARAAGMNIEGVGAAMATITAAGLKTPIAITTLKGTLQALAAPTKEARNGMAELAKQMGVAEIGVKKFKDGSMDILATMKQFEGMDLATIRKVVPSVEGATAILAMANNIETLENNLKGFQDTSGATEDANAKMQKSFDIQFKKIKNTVQGTMIALGSEILPAIMPIVNEMSEFLKDNADKIKAVFVKVGEALAYIAQNTGKFAKAFAGITAAVTGLKIAMIALNVATSANPIGLIITAIVSLGALIWLLIKDIKHGGEWFRWLGNVGKASLQTVGDWLAFLMKTFLKILETIGRAWLSTFEFLWKALSRIFLDLGKRFLNIFKKKEMRMETQSVGEIISEAFQESFDDVAQALKDIEQMGADVVKRTGERFAGLKPPSFKKDDGSTKTDDSKRRLDFGEAKGTLTAEAQKAMAPEVTQVSLEDTGDDADKTKEKVEELGATFQLMGDYASKAVNQIENSFDDFFRSVREGNDTIENSFSKLFEDIVQGFVNMIASLIAKLVALTVTYMALNAITGGQLGTVLALAGGATKAEASAGGFMQGLGSFLTGGATGENIGTAFSQAFNMASGGPAKAGTLYEVNETGKREFFVPNVDGNIVPAESGSPGASGQTVINIHTTDVRGFRDFLRRNPDALNYGLRKMNERY